MIRWVIGFILWTTCAFAQVPMPYGPTSTAVETGRVLKPGPGQLFNFQVTTGGSSGWVLLIDGTAIPSNGTVPGCGTTSPTGCIADWWQVAANQTLTVFYAQNPQQMINGITVVFSTTGPFTMTSSATAVFSGSTR